MFRHAVGCVILSMVVCIIVFYTCRCGQTELLRKCQPTNFPKVLIIHTTKIRSWWVVLWFIDHLTQIQSCITNIRV